jgi:hypothetical protein
MRVFICSTCYDLIDLRAELEIFFREAGVEAVLSDRLSSEFQVMPDRSSIETCLSNVRSCDAFLIILSNRYGPSLAKAGFDDISATHLEYQEAIKSKKSIHMFVRDRLDADYNIWRSNKKHSELELSWCKDRKDWKIFELLEEHRKLTNAGDVKNNWMWIFRDSTELKRRLALDFKEAIARVAVAKLSASGRIPFFEISGRFEQYNPHSKNICFELQIRNLGAVVAVSPTFEIISMINKWSIKSLAVQEQATLHVEWAYAGTAIQLPSRLSYSILDGQKFADEGNLIITYNRNDVVKSKVCYELKKRQYAGAALEMVIG